MLAPHPQHHPPAQHLGLGQCHQLVIHGPADPRLQRRRALTATDQDVGRRLMRVAICADTDRVVRPCTYHLVHVRPERQRLPSPIPGPIHFHGHPGRVLDLDLAPLRRRLQPIGPVRLALQHAAEQANQLPPPDRATAIQPRAIPLDQEWQRPALPRRPPCIHQPAACERAVRCGSLPPIHAIFHVCVSGFGRAAALYRDIGRVEPPIKGPAEPK